MKQNCEEIEGIIKYFNRYEANHKFSFIRGSYSTFALEDELYSGLDPEEEKDSILPYSEMQTIFKKINHLNEVSEHKFLSDIQKEKLILSMDIVRQEKRLIPCFAGKTEGVIYENGDVSVCETVIPLGNLKETDFNFDQLWNSEKANMMRKQVSNCACLQGCNLLSSLHVKRIDRLQGDLSWQN